MKKQTVGGNRRAAVAAFEEVVVACGKVVAARKEVHAAWAKTKTPRQRYGVDCSEVQDACDKANVALVEAGVEPRT